MCQRLSWRHKSDVHCFVIFHHAKLSIRIVLRSLCTVGLCGIKPGPVLHCVHTQKWIHVWTGQQSKKEQGGQKELVRWRSAYLWIPGSSALKLTRSQTGCPVGRWLWRVAWKCLRRLLASWARGHWRLRTMKCSPWRNSPGGWRERL